MFNYIKGVFHKNEKGDQPQQQQQRKKRPNPNEPFDIFQVITPEEFQEIECFTLSGIQLHTLTPTKKDKKRLASN